MGANRKLAGNAEVLWHAFDIGPTPIILSVFADHGLFYRAENSAVDRISAASRGLGISVPMPFGIARFSFADPNRDNGREQRFQFDVRGNWK
jgi:outer membrane protein assembly factor BamA